MNFDVIIIGGGAAGISAALWCDDLRLNALLLESKNELGGQLLWTFNKIKNHLGIEAKDGREMRNAFLKQIENRKFELRLQSSVSSVDLEKKTVSLESGEKFSAAALIIATGVRRRKLNAKGEDEFKGKGIIESGKRDADSAKDKTICIVGGGDAALENALILAETASEVIVVHRGVDFRARAEFLEKAKENPKIKFLTETIVQKILGSERVEAIELEDLKARERFMVKAEEILIRIGVEPNTEFLDGKLDLDQNGYIKINQNCETNVQGIFAVGDAANPLAPTVSSAVGMGATAVKTIFESLKN